MNRRPAKPSQSLDRSIVCFNNIVAVFVSAWSDHYDAAGANFIDCRRVAVGSQQGVDGMTVLVNSGRGICRCL